MTQEEAETPQQDNKKTHNVAFCREVITSRFITLQHIGKVVDIKKKREIHNTDKTVGGIEPNSRKGVIGGSQQWC